HLAHRKLPVRLEASGPKAEPERAIEAVRGQAARALAGALRDKLDSPIEQKDAWLRGHDLDFAQAELRSLPALPPDFHLMKDPAHGQALNEVNLPREAHGLIAVRVGAEAEVRE